MLWMRFKRVTASKKCDLRNDGYVRREQLSSSPHIFIVNRLMRGIDLSEIEINVGIGVIEKQFGYFTEFRVKENFDELIARVGSSFHIINQKNCIDYILECPVARCCHRIKSRKMVLERCRANRGEF